MYSLYLLEMMLWAEIPQLGTKLLIAAIFVR
jgi:hypothetical protein